MKKKNASGRPARTSDQGRSGKGPRAADAGLRGPHVGQTLCEVAFTERTETDKLRHPRCKGLREDKRINDQGEELGAVNDLIIGPDSKIEHIILFRGGVLGPRKVAALPFKPLGVTNRGVFYHGITEEQVQNLPAIPGQ